MRVGSKFYKGQSARSNSEGINNFSVFLKKYGFECIPIPLNDLLHLKSGVSYLENNNLLIIRQLTQLQVFKQFTKIVVPDEEKYAANCIHINKNVIVPKCYQRTSSLIEKLGYKVLTVNVSEFAKIDGELSCLSLRL